VQTAATAAPTRNVTPGFGSTIISDFPDLFDEFRGRQFALLWRGGRDGFGARDFHSRCDGHANTLTLIEDTNGNIFGGFTPLEWESSEPGYKWNAVSRPLATVDLVHGRETLRVQVQTLMMTSIGSGCAHLPGTSKYEEKLQS
jgi:hypothetical protein